MQRAVGSRRWSLRRAGFVLGLLAVGIAPLTLLPAGAVAEEGSSWPFSFVPRVGLRSGSGIPENIGIVPVEFQLGGYRGRNVLVPEAPLSVPVDCDSRSPRIVGSPPSTPATGSLTYDPLTDSYTFWWPRADDWVGTCRKLILKLGDGTIHPLLVYFGKENTALLP